MQLREAVIHVFSVVSFLGRGGGEGVFVLQLAPG